MPYICNFSLWKADTGELLQEDRLMEQNRGTGNKLTNNGWLIFTKKKAKYTMT